jgi:hypothetical protein
MTKKFYKTLSKYKPILIVLRAVAVVALGSTIVSEGDGSVLVKVAEVVLMCVNEIAVQLIQQHEKYSEAEKIQEL